MKRTLTLLEIKEIETKMLSNHYIDNAMLRDWTNFIFSALNEGVSDFDIDQLTMSDDDFDEKYNIK
jgi:hypothetical protein